MSDYPRDLSSKQLLDVLNYSATATAIHTTDEMIIEMANDAMISIWGKDRGVIGKPIEVALPELKGQPFLSMLQQVLHTGETISGSDTMAELVVDGKLQRFYFDFEYRAIKGDNGESICVLHTALDVTQRYLSRQRALKLETELQATNEELAAANEEMAAFNEELASTNEELIATNEELSESQAQLVEMNSVLAQSEARFKSMITQSPIGICIIRAGDLMITEVNDAYLELVGKTQAEMYNRTIWEAVPEAAPVYAPVMNNVIETGERFVANEHLVMLTRHGKPEEVYVNFVYEPLNQADGSVGSIMVLGIDVSPQVHARRAIQASAQRLSSIVMTAPIAMTVLRGRNLVIEVANQPMHDIWQRKPAEVLNKELLAVFPELSAQPFPGLLQSVFDTRERLAISESAVHLNTPEGPVDYILNFSYDPLFDVEGNVEAILATVIDITEQTQARNDLQKARDILKHALDSAQMGTWTVDLETRLIDLSEAAKKMHGLAEDDTITLEQSLKMLEGEYLDIVRDAISKAIADKSSFNIEFMIHPQHSTKQRWLRSTGKAYYNEDGKALTVSGIIMDITELKQQDQRKDDFISIASHELKTPATSLKAALQLLDKMKENPNPALLTKLIEQSNRSMDKMSSLIDDLLNVRRMNEGHLKLNKHRFTLSTMLDECCSHIRAAGKHNLVMTGDRTIEVVADENRIDQVVVNLVNNAVKYAPTSKDIFFIVSREGEMARVEVKDTGPGIDPEKQAHLFERYYRADASGYQNSGLGLGLYISAEIIRRHGGEMGVQSEVGKGSTFWFTLPLSIQG